MPFDVIHDVTGDVRSGWLEAQQLLDGVRDQRAIGDQLPALIRMLAENLAEPAEKAPSRVHTGPRNDYEEGEDLVFGQPLALTRDVVELDVQQFGDQIIG